MSGIQRFDQAHWGMTMDDEHGDYVLYGDHKRKVDGLEAEIARLRAEAKGLSQSLTDALACEQDYLREISDLRAEVEAARNAVRNIRARADSEGTGKQHGPQYVAGLRNAANMIDAAMGADA